MFLDVCGITIQIDDCDYELLMSTNKWRRIHFPDGKGYLFKVRYENGKQYNDYLHRLIMNPGPGEIVDHINGDKNDNRRSNLRNTTWSVNCVNKAYSKKTKTRGGVTKRSNGKFDARVNVSIGIFDTEQEAMDAVREFKAAIYGADSLRALDI
jgi:hypothetical protein